MEILKFFEIYVNHGRELLNIDSTQVLQILTFDTL